MYKLPEEFDSLLKDDDAVRRRFISALLLTEGIAYYGRRHDQWTISELPKKVKQRSHELLGKNPGKTSTKQAT